MNIVFISYYSGKNLRGVETYVHELSNRLAKENFVIVYQSGKQLPNSNYLTKQIDLPLLKFNKEVFEDISPVTNIIIPTNGRLQSAMAKIWCIKHPKTKLIISGQSGPGIDDRLNLWCFPDKFIALTGFQSNWANQVNPFVSIKTIPNGVDLIRFNPQVKPAKIDLPHPIILYVAALEPIKRHELLIRAVARTQASLLLVGQGSLFEDINKLGLSLLSNRFKIMKFSHENIPSVYTACDLFSYPTSKHESFGIAVLEAMSSGLSVVATNDPIRREIIGDAGWCCNPLNIETFSDTINLAISTPPKINPRHQAEKFSWDNIARDYQKLCVSLIS
jgi:glycosyltransferase involved in cell wall biosynthesis